MYLLARIVEYYRHKSNFQAKIFQQWYLDQYWRDFHILIVHNSLYRFKGHIHHCCHYHWLEYSLFLTWAWNLSWMLWNPKSLFIDGNLDKAHLFHRRDITQIFIWTWWSTKISQILYRDALETWSTTLWICLQTLLAMFTTVGK